MTEPDPGGARNDEREHSSAHPRDAGIFAAPVASVFAALLLAALLFGR